MESEEFTSTEPKLSDWSIHDDEPIKSRSPSNLSNRSDEIRPNNITTIVIHDGKKQQEEDDDHAYDDRYKRAGLFWKCCQCCPCLSTIIQDLIVGSIIGTLALTIVLPIFLIQQSNTSRTTTATTPTTSTTSTSSTSSSTTTTNTSTSSTTSTTSSTTSTTSKTTSTSSSTSTSTSSSTSSTSTTSTTSTTATTTTTPICTIGNTINWMNKTGGSSIQYSFKYQALYNLTTIWFGFRGGTTNFNAIDGVSVVDTLSPSVELLQNPSFENSSTSLVGWFQWCQTACGGTGDEGQITNTGCRTGSGNLCYKSRCNTNNDFVGQTFPTIVGRTYNISFWLFQSNGISPRFTFDVA